MSSVSDANPLHVVVLGNWLPFPHGMAVTSRARLMARALLRGGARVHVLTLQAADYPPHVENTAVRGEYRGISFEYACGTTIRHDRFLARRLVAAWGWLHGALRLAQLRRSGRMDIVLLWFWTPRPSVRHFLFVGLLHLMRVPVVREVDEPQWSHWAGGSALGRLVSPLVGMAGAVTISAELHAWAEAELQPNGRLRILDVPILVDVDEQQPSHCPTDGQTVLFAGSPGDKKLLRFIFSAMREVWRTHPDCRLIITASDSSFPGAEWLATEIGSTGLAQRVDLVGYVDRDELLALYARATALLIPLGDDLRSRSRFPTKIGEYLASGRPIVTSAVGEISRFFTNGVDAMVCPPDDPVAYGRAIAELLADPDRATRVGLEGRRLAENRFHYALYGETLARAFAEIAGKASPAGA